MTPLRKLLPALALVGLLSARSEAAALYNLTDLGTFDPSYINAQGMAVSNPKYGVTAPSVAYSAYGPGAGQLTTIPNSFIAEGINAQGQVISGTPSGGSIVSAPVVSPTGVLTYQTVASDPTNHYAGINDQGQLVGETLSGHPFLQSGGQMIDLGILGKSNGFASAINSNGDFVGSYELGGPTATPYRGTYHAFLYSNGKLTDLGTLGGGESNAYSITANGQVLGTSTTSSGAYHQFLYSGGTMTDLNNLGGAPNVSVAAINASGSMVGSFQPPSGPSQAFLYSNGVMSDLNSLIPLPTGWNLFGASGINDSGHIIGLATDPSGATHGFMMTPPGMAAPTPPTPTPEPTTLALFGLAGFGLVARRAIRRRAV